MKFQAGQIAESLCRLNDTLALAVSNIEPNEIEETADKLFKLYCEITESLRAKDLLENDDEEGIELPLLPIKLEYLYLLEHDELNKIKNRLEDIEIELVGKLEQ